MMFHLNQGCSWKEFYENFNTVCVSSITQRTWLQSAIVATSDCHSTYIDRIQLDLFAPEVVFILIDGSENFVSIMGETLAKLVKEARGTDQLIVGITRKSVI